MREPKKESNVQNKKTKYPSNGGTACIWARPEMLAIIDELIKHQQRLQQIGGTHERPVDAKERKDTV